MSARQMGGRTTRQSPSCKTVILGPPHHEPVASAVTLLGVPLLPNNPQGPTYTQKGCR